jgi:hypothetical protein
MKMCISIIHLGRYKIDILDDDNQIVRSYDCGLAGVLVALNNWIFVPEHIAYQGDQRKSSDQLGQEAIQKMIADLTLNPNNMKQCPKCGLWYSHQHSDKVCNSRQRRIGDQSRP